MITKTTIEDIWKSFALCAEHVCLRIELERPELILVIYKSGSLMWQAVSQWWQITRGHPLPSVVGANLGTKFFDDYAAAGYEFHHLEYESAVHIGFAIAWVLDHQEWKEALGLRIQTVLGEKTPSKILVIDDVIAQGRTSILVLSLLWALFPGTQTSVYAGLPFDWREILGNTWFAQNDHNHLLDTSVRWQPSDKLAQLGISFTEAFPWQYLVSGLANSETDNVGWQLLTNNHPLIMYLLQHFPGVDWLNFPKWVQVSLSHNLNQWLPQREHLVISQQVVRGFPWRLSESRLQLPQRVAALIWQNTSLSVQEAALLCRVSHEQAQLAINKLVQTEELVAVDHLGVMKYQVSTDLDIYE